jgi:hypothetical protein
VQRADEGIGAGLLDGLRPPAEAADRPRPEEAAGHLHVVGHEVGVAEDDGVAGDHGRARRVEELARHGDRQRLGARGGRSGRDGQRGQGGDQRGAAPHRRTR